MDLLAEDQAKYAVAWRDYLRRRKALLASVLGYLPFGVLVTLFIVGMGWSYKIAEVAAMLWLVGAILVGVHYMQWPCPKCGKVFHMAGRTKNIFAQRCQHCDLSKAEIEAIYQNNPTAMPVA